MLQRVLKLTVVTDRTVKTAQLEATATLLLLQQGAAPKVSTQPVLVSSFPNDLPCKKIEFFQLYFLLHWVADTFDILK